MVDDSGGVESDPLVGWVPLQPPEAVQDCALLAFQVNVMVWPDLMLVELDCSDTDGFATVVPEVVGVPLPAGVKLSPWHAANTETTAQAEIQAVVRT